MILFDVKCIGIVDIASVLKYKIDTLETYNILSKITNHYKSYKSMKNVLALFIMPFLLKYRIIGMY